MLFTFSDILKLLPELMLALLGVLVIIGDLFAGKATQEQRFRDAASTTTLGLGLIFIVVVLQSGFLIDRVVSPSLDPATVANPIGRTLLGLLRNLQTANNTTLLNGGLLVDNLLMISRLIFIGAGLGTAILIQDRGRTSNSAEFFGLLAFSIVGLNLMAGAGELIAMYLALELASITLYILAGYLTADARSSEAGLKYYIFGSISSAILLYGFSLLYGYMAMGGVANPTSISAIVQTLGSGSTSPLLLVAVVMIIAGMGYKLAIVPFHSWSPDVYQGAPTAVTALLSSASKVAGFVLLYRILGQGLRSLAGTAELMAGLGGWAGMLAAIAAATMIVGNLAALTQENAKRLLAYSSIAHAGFLLIGFVAIYTAVPQSTAGAQGPNQATTFGTLSLLYYLIVYAVTNLGAFGALAVVGNVLHGDDIRDLDGLYRRNLGLASLFVFFVLSLAGIPPLGGFWAKYFVFSAGWESGAWWLVIIAMINTLLGLYYYLRLLKAMFIAEPVDDRRIIVPRTTYWALIVAAVFVLLLGLFPGWFLPVLQATTQVAGVR